jgi:predicted GNAT family acetyltransferase
VTTDVRDNPAANRYEIYVDGALAGFAEYHLHRDLAAFTHTEVDDAHQGQGVASELIKGALDDARARALRVEPFCRFVRAFIEKHRDEYRDLVPEPEWERFGLGG